MLGFTGTIWPDMVQKSEAWYKARMGRPTASNFDRILKANGSDTSCWEEYAIELMAQTIDPVEHEQFSFVGNMDTDRGNELEAEAADLFADIMGLEIEEIGFITRADNVIGCSPDRLVPGGGSYRAGLEIKAPRAKAHLRTLIHGKMPDDHLQQVHGSMAVTGLDVWYFMSYHRKMEPFIEKIEWDEYTDKMADALDRFLAYYGEMRSKWVNRAIGKEVTA